MLCGTECCRNCQRNTQLSSEWPGNMVTHHTLTLVTTTGTWSHVSVYTALVTGDTTWTICYHWPTRYSVRQHNMDMCQCCIKRNCRVFITNTVYMGYQMVTEPCLDFRTCTVWNDRPDSDTDLGYLWQFSYFQFSHQMDIIVSLYDKMTLNILAHFTNIWEFCVQYIECVL